MQRINAHNLLRFVNGLADFAKDQNCDMEMNYIRPSAGNECGTPGCHAGIALLVLKDLVRLDAPWMPDKNGCLIGLDYQSGFTRLNKYLLNVTPYVKANLMVWAAENPDLWGNPYGDYMFTSGLAFGQKRSFFPATVLADHWTGVLQRVKAQYTEEAQIIQQHYGLADQPDYKTVDLELMLLEARINNDTATEENRRLWEDLRGRVPHTHNN